MRISAETREDVQLRVNLCQSRIGVARTSVALCEEKDSAVQAYTNGTRVIAAMVVVLTFHEFGHAAAGVCDIDKADILQTDALALQQSIRN
jgi:hypothetical protein